jgi:hypothetical protein
VFEWLLKLADRLSARLPVSRRKARLRRLRRRVRRAADALLLRPPKPDKVSFVIGGVQKGGTTALDNYLRSCPRICMGDQKEVNFFTFEDHFRRRRVNYNTYHAHYSPGDPACILGDASPDYMFVPAAPGRICEYNPKMKWILLLRNPIARAYSAWNMLRHRGEEKMSFHEAIMMEPERCRGSLSGGEAGAAHFYHNYTYRGFYTEQVRRIWHFFPPEQTLVMRSSALRNKTAETLRRILEFLGLPEHGWPDLEPVHVTPYESGLERTDFAYLRNLYEYDVRALERMLGWDCSEWLEHP